MNKVNLVEEMIDLYAKKHNCIDEGEELKAYAKMRLAKCPFQKDNLFCSQCKIHCYEPEKREMIRKVMRYAGPRMMFVHPILSICHLLAERRQK